MGGFVYPTANVERTPIIGFLPSPDRRAVPSHGSTIPTDKEWSWTLTPSFKEVDALSFERKEERRARERGRVRPILERTPRRVMV